MIEHTIIEFFFLLLSIHSTKCGTSYTFFYDIYQYLSYCNIMIALPKRFDRWLFCCFFFYFLSSSTLALLLQLNFSICLNSIYTDRMNEKKWDVICELLTCDLFPFIVCWYSFSDKNFCHLMNIQLVWSLWYLILKWFCFFFIILQICYVSHLREEKTYWK